MFTPSLIKKKGEKITYEFTRADNHARNEDKYLPFPRKYLIFPRSMHQILHYLFEVHVLKIVPHQRCIRYQVLELELK